MIEEINNHLKCIHENELTTTTVLAPHGNSITNYETQLRLCPGLTIAWLVRTQL